jgi:LacI family repressor for deo operon, udp, cdd, tsx, nupC, and nupG
VSTATVSRCLNEPERVREETRERVQQAIRKTGYSPNILAQSFRRGRTKIIMVVLPSVGDPFFTTVMGGLRRVAAEHGYSLLINETQFNTVTADEVGAMMVSRQVDGIVLLASMSPFGPRVLSARNQRALPIVIGCETVSAELSDYPSVHIDNTAAAAEGTRYLLSQGHRRIAFMTGRKQSPLTRDRERGYREAMGEAAQPVRDGWVVEGGMSIDGAVAATQALVSHREQPTAIFCANDEMAIGCMHGLKDAGKEVPRDVSVMGFDDTRYAAVTDPPLTTIRQPAAQIGERVMHRLLAALNDDDIDSQPEIVPHRLIVRASVSPPHEG